MVGMWVEESFSVTADELRQSFQPEGGWWYPKDVTEALEMHGISFSVEQIRSYRTLTKIIDAGHIAIINNNMGYIPFNSEQQERVQRFYQYDSGHFLMLKGYAIVDGNLYFEVSDPNNWGNVYTDGQPIGENVSMLQKNFCHQL